jgi:YidC/Oxa1 family membrane protein insertase
MIFLALPFFFVIFIINFPAGLLVYWITTNLWTIVQQAIIRKRLGPMRPPGQEGGMGLGELLRGGSSSTPATATAGGGGGSDGNPPKGRPSGPPPAPPRRKKKRSGRRR